MEKNIKSIKDASPVISSFSTLKDFTFKGDTINVKWEVKRSVNVEVNINDGYTTHNFCGLNTIGDLDFKVQKISGKVKVQITCHSNSATVTETIQLRDITPELKYYVISPNGIWKSNFKYFMEQIGWVLGGMLAGIASWPVFIALSMWVSNLIQFEPLTDIVSSWFTPIVLGLFWIVVIFKANFKQMKWD